MELDEGIDRVGEVRVVGAAPTFRLQGGQNFGRETSSEDAKKATSTPAARCARTATYLLVLFAGSLRMPRLGSCHGKGIISKVVR